MNLNISNQYISNHFGKIFMQRLDKKKKKEKQTNTHTWSEIYMHALTQVHSKLSVSEKTHSAALTPRLRAHITIPLACQSWKL